MGWHGVSKAHLDPPVSLCSEYGISTSSCWKPENLTDSPQLWLSPAPGWATGRACGPGKLLVPFVAVPAQAQGLSGHSGHETGQERTRTGPRSCAPVQSQPDSQTKLFRNALCSEQFRLNPEPLEMERLCLVLASSPSLPPHTCCLWPPAPFSPGVAT